MHRGYALMACILSSVTTTLAASDWPMQARKHPNSEEPWIIAPWESTWTNSLAICVMIGPYENATDFQEFLQYHQCASAHRLAACKPVPDHERHHQAQHGAGGWASTMPM